MMFWYVLRSKPNKEAALWREALARKLECFYPSLHVNPVNPRSRKVRPYFPGYLFVHVDIEQTGFSTLQWLPFSLGLVSFDGRPATVPDVLIHAIQKCVKEINETGGDKAATSIKHGETIVIQDGPFAGYEAIFDAQLSGSERVRVFLKLLQRRQMMVELPVGQIQRKDQR
jgi:transcription antitermination factor NusG